MYLINTAVIKTTVNYFHFAGFKFSKSVLNIKFLKVKLLATQACLIEGSKQTNNKLTTKNLNLDIYYKKF